MNEDLQIRKDYQTFLKSHLKNDCKIIYLKALESDLSITKTPKMYAHIPITFLENTNSDKYTITTKFKVGDQEFIVNLLTPLSWSPNQFIKNTKTKIEQLLIEQLDRKVWIKFNTILF